MMTVDEVREHAERLQGRLETERKKVETGHYTGPRSVHLELIEALEGRIGELLDQCSKVEATAAEAVAA